MHFAEIRRDERRFTNDYIIYIGEIKDIGKYDIAKM
jgi:hypothetical protein